MRYYYRLLKDREIVVREEFLQEEGEKHSSEIYNRPEKNIGMLFYCASCILCFFLQIKVYSNITSSKSIGTIFLITFVQF